MNKYYPTLIMIAIFLFGKPINAQEFTILGGPNISNMSIKADGDNVSEKFNFKPRIGGHAGLLIDLRFGKVFSLETGLIFITKGYRFQIPTLDDVQFKYNSFYMDIPVLAKFNWNPKENFRLYGGFGPAMGIALMGKIKNDGVNDAQADYIETNYPTLPVKSKKINYREEIKRMDIGIMFTGGINVAGVRVGIFYNQGIRSLEYKNYTQRNRAAGVHVGYTFQFKDKE